MEDKSRLEFANYEMNCLVAIECADDLRIIREYIDAKFEDLYERLEKTLITNNLAPTYLPEK